MLEQMNDDAKETQRQTNGDEGPEPLPLVFGIFLGTVQDQPIAEILQRQQGCIRITAAAGRTCKGRRRTKAARRRTWRWR